jgi:Fe-S oxidoreductase
MDAKTRDKLLELFESKLNQAMQLYLETCTRCGVCIEACHVYASTGQVKHIAAYRAEVVRRIYKKYFKARGKVWPKVGECKELTDMALEELYQAAYSCTGCRRCMVYCPFGIDTQMLMSIAKLLLIGADAEPEILSLLADTSIEKGKSIDVFKEGFLQGIKNIEKQVIDRWQMEAGETAIPVGVEGADLLYVALAGAHSIIPAAVVFNAAKENWTLSFFEAVNFGAFVGDPTRTKLILDRIIDEALRLQVKEVCICEYGTAYRVMKQLSGRQPFKVTAITEVHARYILKHLTNAFREMSPDPTYNWCCGGGGGLVALGEETLDFRMKSARVKSEQVTATEAAILATACENCHTQLDNLYEHYDMNVQVRFLSSMVADALAI